jgi:hypothetical protein
MASSTVSSAAHAVESSQFLSTQVDQPSGFCSAKLSNSTGNDIFHDNHGDSHNDHDNDFCVVESRSKCQRQHTNKEMQLELNQTIIGVMQQPSHQM